MYSAESFGNPDRRRRRHRRCSGARRACRCARWTSTRSPS